MFVGGNLVTWCSKKQTMVDCSSAEAKYRAMAHITYDLIWIQSLLSEMGVVFNQSMVMYSDNRQLCILPTILYIMRG